jgi:hypothetical protein
MNTFKVYGNKPYEHIVKASNSDEAINIVNSLYPGFISSEAIQTNTEQYQSSYDDECFDSNGRRKF